MKFTHPAQQMATIIRLLGETLVDPKIAILLDVDAFNKASEEIGLPFRLVKEDDGN